MHEHLISLRKGLTTVIVGFFLFGYFAIFAMQFLLIPIIVSLIGLFTMRSAIVALGGVNIQKQIEPDLPQPLKELTKTEPIGKIQLQPHVVQQPHATIKTAESSWKNNINWEEWIGKKLLQKLGIIVVLIGMLVLLKYSFDNRWIGELGRIGLSVLGAIALLGAGEWFSKKFPHWAYAFTGGGLALLYFTVWVADVFYADALFTNHGLSIGATTATFLYAFITLIGVLASIRYDAQIIAWFAMLGGFLTPHLIDVTQATPMGFVLYLTILTAGILGIAWYKHWKYLNLVCFLLAQYSLYSGIFSLPAHSFSDTQQFVTAIGFFLLFGILPYVSQLHKQVIAETDDIALVILNGLTVYWAMIDAIGGITGTYVGLTSLALATVYVGFAGLTLTIRSKSNALINTYLVASIILIALALLAELKTEWVAVGWAPFSALLMLVAAKLKRSGPVPCAMVLLAGSLFFLSVNLPVNGPMGEALWHPLTSVWALQNYIVFASVIAWILTLRRLPLPLLPRTALDSGQNILHALLALLLFTAITLESTALDWTIDLGWTFGILIFCAIAVSLFSVLRSKVWLIATIAANILTLVFIFALNSTFGLVGLMSAGQSNTAVPIVHAWAGLSVLTLLVPVVLSVLILRREPLESFRKLNIHIMLIGIALMQIWIHGTVEILNINAYSHWSPETTQRILSGWWILFAASLIGWSVLKQKKSFRRIGLALLAPPLLMDLAIIGQATNSFYQPVLWTAIMAALALLGAKEKERDFTIAAITILALVAGFDMLTHMGYQGAGLLRTVWWAIVALSTIVHGFLSREALLRRTGIALFGIVTAKLLLVDFSVLDTFVRIVASIVTGLLMIGASYLYQRFGSVFESPQNHSSSPRS